MQDSNFPDKIIIRIISVHKTKKNPAIAFKAVNRNCLCVCSFTAVTRSGKTHFARSVSLVLTVASLAARVLPFSGTHTEGEPPATDIVLLHISGRNTGNPEEPLPQQAGELSPGGSLMQDCSNEGGSSFYLF